MSQWVVHRDPRFFPEPHLFRPERWDGAQAQALPRFAYFPFGGGPRICIGQPLALMEAKLVLAAICQRFRLADVRGQRIEPCPHRHPAPEPGRPASGDAAARCPATAASGEAFACDGQPSAVDIAAASDSNSAVGHPPITR